LKQNTNYQEIRERIRGPVFPIVIPFTEKEDVDYDGLHRYIEYLINGNAPVLLVTVGTSRFNLLTRQEMLNINETVVKSAAGRAVTIVAGPGPTRGSTRENIDFAQHAKSIGADAILTLYPERWYGDKPVIEFFNKIADSTDIGIMVHAIPMRNGFGGVKDLTFLDSGILTHIVGKPNVIGIKEENGDRAIFEDVLLHFNQKVPVIGAGGAMRRFLNDHKLGSYTYLVGIGSFKPELAVDFYRAVINGDVDEAEKIAKKYEDSYFDFAVKYGWHRVLKETLYQLDIMPPYEREPFNRINEAERSKLQKVMIECNWLNGGK